MQYDKCVKCNTPKNGGDVECPKCGVVYEKAEKKYEEVMKKNEEENKKKNEYISCPICDEEFSRDHAVCPYCGKLPEFFNDDDKNNKIEFEKKQLLGLIGSLILFLGVFAPIISVPIVGGMNYFQNGKGDGTIVLILAVISLILVLKKKYKRLWFTGIGSLAVMSFTFINFQIKMSRVKTDMKAELGDNPFGDFANVAIQSIQLQWGWALLIIGAVLLIVSAEIKN